MAALNMSTKKQWKNVHPNLESDPIALLFDGKKRDPVIRPNRIAIPIVVQVTAFLAINFRHWAPIVWSWC
jgi:hypothetical protein